MGPMGTSVRLLVGLAWQLVGLGLGSRILGLDNRPLRGRPHPASSLGSGAAMILGVDPSTAFCGWALVRSATEYVGSGVIDCRTRGKCSACGHRLAGKNTRAQALAQLGEAFDALLSSYPTITMIAMESAYVGAYASGVIAVSEARGVVAGAAARHGHQVVSVEPSRHKLCSAGSGRATKEETAIAVGKIYGVTTDRYDESDALSIAYWAAVTKGVQ
jgi:Holliday junction resolvasome RuvABC endonuclease subunit